MIGTFVFGCASKAKNLVKVPAADAPLPRVVAVLPLENRTNDHAAAALLRAKLIDELYFKGYAKIDADFIDHKLEELDTSNGEKNIYQIQPQQLSELLGADAVLYATLQKSEKGNGFFSAPVEVSLSCELRRTDNGETIWKNQQTAKRRNFALTRKGKEMKSCQAYEEILEEVVRKIMDTMPDGPNLRS